MAVGSCTRIQAWMPTNQAIAPMTIASSRFVAITLCRWRRRILRDQKRGPIISDQIGPIPNITNGLRKRRYPSRYFQEREVYSSTVSVGTSPVPRRSRSPAVP